MAKPDILLIVGANTGASYKELQNGINGVVKAINKNHPPKIKVTLDDTDFQKKLNTLKKQISSISNQKITLNFANNLQSAVSSVGTAAAKAANNVSKIKEMLNTKDIDASVAKVTDRFEKLGDSGAKGLGKIKTDIAQINTLLASLKSPQVLSNDNALLDTYQKLSTLLETVINKISIIESRTNTAKKINFGIDTEKFKTDIDVLQQKLNELTNKTAPLYSTITKNMTDLQAAFKQMNDPAATQDQRVAAYQRLKDLIPVVTKQIRTQTAEETAAAKAAKKAKTEAVRGTKQQISENEQANVQRRIAYQLITQITQAQQEWTKARNGTTSNEYARLQTYNNQLNTLLSQFATKSISSTKFSSQVKSIGDEFARTSSIIRTAGEDTRGLADRFGSLAGKFSMWFSTTRIIMMVYTNIRKMISASIELDKSMTQLQIVTKENDEVMAKFGDTAAAAAKRIGSSITDFVSSATTYARLGYSLNESSQLAEFTAMLQNVGDIDVSQAQEAITSIVKAFNIGTDQIESVMDKMVVSGNNFPISVSQIAEGMKNASSALAAAGNSFDQSVALLTAANSTLQDSAKSSTGLRTIAARIRRTKTELDDLGETISEAEYEKLIKALTDMNVALTENGEYRSTYDIIKDIAAQWKNLTSMEQAALTEALAGTRQQSVFSGLVNNFQEASGAMEAMASSAGELRESYATYMESAEAHINQLKAAFESLAQSIFNSDSIKSVVDMLAGLLTTLDNIVKTIGGVPTIITGIAAALSAFENVGRGK